jgi:hypothetical protein
MPPTYWNQLRTLGVPSQQVPTTDLHNKLLSGDPSFTIDVEPDPDTRDPYLVTFFYSTQDAARPVNLTHFISTLYHPVTNDILRCRMFPVLGETAVPTIREAKNLLQGRAVWKQFYPGTPLEYPAWLWLDFSRKDAEGEYKLLMRSATKLRNLEQILLMYPIVGLEDPDYMVIITNALKSGELIEVTLRPKGATLRRKVLEYDPRLSVLKLHIPGNRVPTINI